MKRFIIALFLFGGAAVQLTSCKRDQDIPAPVADTIPIVFPQLSADPNKQFYKFIDAQASVASNPTRPVFEFVLSPSSSGNTQLASVLVYKTFRRSGAYGARVLVGEYSNFPATVSLNSQDALNGLTRAGGFLVAALAANPTQRNLILRNDAVLFTFDYRLTDGRIITSTPVDATGTISNTTLINPPYAIAATFKDS